MIRFSTKYLDGLWRTSNYTMQSKEGEMQYAKELVEMFKHFLYKGNILGYRVEIIKGYIGEIATGCESEKCITVIGTEEM